MYMWLFASLKHFKRTLNFFLEVEIATTLKWDINEFDFFTVICLLTSSCPYQNMCILFLFEKYTKSRKNEVLSKPHLYQF